MPGLRSYSLVAIGSAIGGVLRFWLAELISSWSVQPFPWEILVINVSGSWAIGFFAGLTGPQGRIFVSEPWRQFFMVGICGGYTTFSAFSLQTITLLQQGRWFLAALNIVLSLSLCLAGVWLGHVGAMIINRRLKHLPIH